jgi:hypothetical protein
MRHETLFFLSPTPTDIMVHLSSNSTISSKLFPFVSGKNIMTNKAPTRELKAKINIVPCMPTMTIKEDKNCKREAISFLINRQPRALFSNLDELP